MNKANIVYVILHYKTFKDTIECVESIKNNTNTSFHIIVVDNFSCNGSLEKLKNKYELDDNVSLIQNAENYGFSKGLNAGIKFAQSNFIFDYIILCNNDIVLLSTNIYSILQQEYEYNHFAVLGPTIITKDGSANSNPLRLTVKSLDEALRDLKKTKIRLFLSRYKIEFLYEILSYFYKVIRNKKSNLYSSKSVLNCKLHGCFWVLSTKYFEKFELLKELTFLYGEEDILHFTVLKEGLHTLFCPNILVYHKEDASTDTLFSKSNEKRIFIFTNRIKALKAYINLLKTNNS